MTATQGHPRSGHPEDNFSEFAEELRLLAEAVLERVEPVLRRTAADGRTQWSSCAWCPVCAAAAVVRGEHHDVVAAIADHGTAIVTVLREALAGVPVEPVLPPDLDPESPEYQAWLHHSFGHGSDPAHSGGGATGGHPRAGGVAGDEFGTAADDSAGNDEAVQPDSTASRAHAAGAHTGASAALATLIARFAAGAQGIRSERARAGHSAAPEDRPDGDVTGGASAETGPDTGFRASGANSGAGVDGGDPGGRADGTAGRRARGDDSGSGTQSGVSAGRRERETASGSRSFGRGPDAAGRPGDASEPGRGRGATRAGYVPIDVTIKA
ncbi:hypothetical protein AB0L82_30530 [Nocardia sp. NPDC052001]|uniref:hypothetical protein n=1 Tax=Nocardia sp. NPDC052001 TaxID=3154853 RepID=UPI0034222A3C